MVLLIRSGAYKIVMGDLILDKKEILFALIFLYFKDMTKN